MLALKVPAWVWTLLMGMLAAASPVVALLSWGVAGCGCSGGGGAGLSATFGCLVGLTRMGLALGRGTATAVGAGGAGAGEGFSVARTFSWSVGCFGGSGIWLTMVA